MTVCKSVEKELSSSTSATPSDLGLLECGEGLSISLLPQGLRVFLQGHVRVGGGGWCRSLQSPGARREREQINVHSTWERDREREREREREIERERERLSVHSPRDKGNRLVSTLPGREREGTA